MLYLTQVDATSLLSPSRCWHSSSYKYSDFAETRVHIDYHVEVERHRDSVPLAIVGQVPEARVMTTVAELMHWGQRVASHGRSSRQGGFTTTPPHMPAAHRAHIEWT